MASLMQARGQVIAPSMAKDRLSGEQPQPKRRGWDRRRDLGRRLVRDRRREAIAVAVDRRSRVERRVFGRRSSGPNRRVSHPNGLRIIEQ